MAFTIDHHYLETEVKFGRCSSKKHRHFTEILFDRRFILHNKGRKRRICCFSFLHLQGVNLTWYIFNTWETRTVSGVSMLSMTFLPVTERKYNLSSDWGGGDSPAFTSGMASFSLEIRLHRLTQQLESQLRTSLMTTGY